MELNNKKKTTKGNYVNIHNEKVQQVEANKGATSDLEDCCGESP